MGGKNVVAILQARTGSTRLPSKVLRPILGKPMLEWQLERVLRAARVDAFVVATTRNPSDDVVADIAARAGVWCFRGDETDVLDRYYQAARSVRADTVVRITGDCPLHDPAVIDEVVERFRARDVDYTMTPVNYPEGVDAEVFSFDALLRAWKEAALPSEREHVTPYIRNHPERFALDESWTSGTVDGAGMHWSVDTERDFDFVEQVFRHLHVPQRAFGMRDVLELLARDPELRETNAGATGYEGLAKSRQEEAERRKSRG